MEYELNDEALLRHIFREILTRENNYFQNFIKELLGAEYNPATFGKIIANVRAYMYLGLDGANFTTSTEYVNDVMRRNRGIVEQNGKRPSISDYIGPVELRALSLALKKTIKDYNNNKSNYFRLSIDEKLNIIKQLLHENTKRIAHYKDLSNYKEYDSRYKTGEPYKSIKEVIKKSYPNKCSVGVLPKQGFKYLSLYDTPITFEQQKEKYLKVLKETLNYLADYKQENPNEIFKILNSSFYDCDAASDFCLTDADIVQDPTCQNLYEKSDLTLQIRKYKALTNSIDGLAHKFGIKSIADYAGHEVRRECIKDGLMPEFSKIFLNSYIISEHVNKGIGWNEVINTEEENYFPEIFTH